MLPTLQQGQVPDRPFPEITYDMYRKALKCISDASQKAAVTSRQNPKYIADAMRDISSGNVRTDFGGLGRDPGMNRADLDDAVQLPIEDIDMEQYQKDLVLMLFEQMVPLMMDLILSIVDPLGLLGILAGALGGIDLDDTGAFVLPSGLGADLREGFADVSSLPSSTPGGATPDIPVPDTDEFIKNKQQGKPKHQVMDCVAIAAAFEKGANASATEQSVYAPASRGIQNTVIMASTVKPSLMPFITDSVEEISLEKQAEIGINETVTDIRRQASSRLENSMLRAFDTKSDDLLETVFSGDCIPCLARIKNFMEFNPVGGLLDIFEADLRNRLSFMNSLGDLFSNISIYSDLCELMSIFSFQCIPDLQRIIVILMALLGKYALGLDGILSFLQQLIAPLFSPVLEGLNTLLQQFLAVVIAPIQCIIDSIILQMQKLTEVTGIASVAAARAAEAVLPADSAGAVSGAAAATIAAGAEANKFAKNVSTGLKDETQKFAVGLQSSLAEITGYLTSGVNFVKGQADELLDMLDKLFGDWSLNDFSMTDAMMSKMRIIRLINVLVAIVDLLTSGIPVCDPGKDTPSKKL